MSVVLTADANPGTAAWSDVSDQALKVQWFGQFAVASQTVTGTTPAGTIPAGSYIVIASLANDDTGGSLGIVTAASVSGDDEVEIVFASAPVANNGNVNVLVLAL